MDDVFEVPAHYKVGAEDGCQRSKRGFLGILPKNTVTQK
jgi:hypothetical protein